MSSVLWNYIYSILYSYAHGNRKKEKILLGIFVSGHVLLLLYYKYYAFLIESLGLENVIQKSTYDTIVLPVGISFFTFQGISYIIDVYRKTEKPELNPIKQGLFITFFPQLIAGPIIKYNEIASEIKERKIDSDNLVLGSQKFIRGLTKKVVFADNFSIIADNVFNSDYSSLPTSVAWLGLFAYSLQIYFDFSGYSDMAIGMGKMMGFNIPENFNFPYAAKSMQEFWRRWHISLSTWFKNYLYIPLGGNKKSKLRTYLNLFLVFFITGLWHGASYNFVIWGLIHGFFLILERLSQNFSFSIPKLIKHLYVILVISISWVFFRCETLSDSITFISKLLSFTELGDYYVLILLNNYVFLLFLAGILFSIGARKWHIIFNVRSVNFNITTSLLYLIVLVYCLSEMAVSTNSPFIYYQF